MQLTFKQMFVKMFSHWGIPISQVTIAERSICRIKNCTSRIPLGIFRLVLSIAVLSSKCEADNRQNIIFIMADDLGWNDVSYHGSDQIQTPNIDMLAYHGVVLKNYYSEPTCTSATAAFLTGKYSIRTGMQGHSMHACEDRGIPVSEKLLPSYLKEHGYDTHIVGKWNVGHSRRDYLPTRRGFDSHFGFFGPAIDYYEYTREEPLFQEKHYGPHHRHHHHGHHHDHHHDKQEPPKLPKIVSGYALYNNMEPAFGYQGYSTDLFTQKAISIIQDHNSSKPLFLYLAYNANHVANYASNLQAPPEAVRKHAYIADSNRRYYAAMTSKLDEGVGNVIAALESSKLLDNTLIVFVSDNGANTMSMHSNFGLNLPFRGQKNSPYEGGVRVPAILWSPKLNGSRTWDGLMHVSDWLPTIMGSVSADVPEDLDGVNQWDVLLNEEDSVRSEILVSLDDVSNFASYRMGDYKLIQYMGNETEYFRPMFRWNHFANHLLVNSEYPPIYKSIIDNCKAKRSFEKNGRYLDLSVILCLRDDNGVNQFEDSKDPEACLPGPSSLCLYNVLLDPMEQHDIAADYPEIVEEIRRRIEDYYDERVPREAMVCDAKSDPENFNYVWTPWLDDEIEDEAKMSKTM